MYQKADSCVRRLKLEEDFTIEEKDKKVTLTEDGIAKCEKFFGIENIGDPENMEYNHHVIQALNCLLYTSRCV